MRIKKFTAGSMREALMKIKNELGEEAIILKTRKLPKKVFPLGGKEEVEVTAAIDDAAVPQPVLPPINMKGTGVYGRPRTTTSIIDPDAPGAPSIRRWEPPRNQSKKDTRDEQSSSDRAAGVPRRSEDRREQLEMVELKENVRELREMVREVLAKGTTQSTGEFTGGWAILYKKLVDAEVKPAVAETVIKQIGTNDVMLSESQAEKKFTTAITASFPVSGPLKLKKSDPLVVTFIGPTGSGKTTTLAKLAAHCRINKKKKVSIITADTYRIAAIEQIRMFADIIKVNIQVVFTPEEIPTVFEACAGDDIVLIDTAGRSQRNHEHMADLKALLSSLHSDEIHLVLSGSTKDSDLLECITRYRPLGVNRLLFTKLDETARVGNIFNVVHESGLPVSYLTTGQSVPDDIEVAQASRFVERLFDGSAL